MMSEQILNSVPLTLEQTITEALQFIYSNDSSNFYYLNRTFYKDTQQTRKILVKKGRRELIQKKDGEYREWYKNGQLKIRYKYNKDNKIEKKYEEWYPNGQLRFKIYYINGQRHGPGKSWYENGQLANVLLFYKNNYYFSRYYNMDQQWGICNCLKG